MKIRSESQTIFDMEYLRKEIDHYTIAEWCEEILDVNATAYEKWTLGRGEIEEELLIEFNRFLDENLYEYGPYCYMSINLTTGERTYFCFEEDNDTFKFFPQMYESDYSDEKIIRI